VDFVGTLRHFVNNGTALIVQEALFAVVLICIIAS